jgi:hypothetical protein
MSRGASRLPRRLWSKPPDARARAPGNGALPPRRHARRDGRKVSSQGGQRSQLPPAAQAWPRLPQPERLAEAGRRTGRAGPPGHRRRRPELWHRAWRGEPSGAHVSRASQRSYRAPARAGGRSAGSPAAGAPPAAASGRERECHAPTRRSRLGSNGRSRNLLGFAPKHIVTEFSHISQLNALLTCRGQVDAAAVVAAAIAVGSNAMRRRGASRRAARRRAAGPRGLTPLRVPSLG